MLVCSDSYNICNRALYIDEDSSGNPRFGITGVVNRAACEQDACPATDYQFEKKSDGEKFILTVNEPSLTIIKEGVVKVKQHGIWSQ